MVTLAVGVSGFVAGLDGSGSLLGGGSSFGPGTRMGLGTRSLKSLPAALRFAISMFRVCSLFSMNDFRDSRRHVIFVSVMLVEYMVTKVSMHSSPKCFTACCSKFSVRRPLLWASPSAILIAPAEVILFFSSTNSSITSLCFRMSASTSQPGSVISHSWSTSFLTPACALRGPASCSNASVGFIRKDALFVASKTFMAGSVETCFTKSAIVFAPKEGIAPAPRFRSRKREVARARQ
mmetsp:Transcript_109821/g.309660  ORF Transcript_109821/g.309660 Transcript_109821/m.309660 type:complete len:236 (-) Transcript_109821:26-733(-)